MGLQPLAKTVENYYDQAKSGAVNPNFREYRPHEKYTPGNICPKPSEAGPGEFQDPRSQLSEQTVKSGLEAPDDICLHPSKMPSPPESQQSTGGRRKVTKRIMNTPMPEDTLVENDLDAPTLHKNNRRRRKATGKREDTSEVDADGHTKYEKFLYWK